MFAAKTIVLDDLKHLLMPPALFKQCAASFVAEGSAIAVHLQEC